MLYYLTDSALNQTSAAFRIRGPDANTYLQGQFTQDLNRPIGSLSYGLLLNQKGKVVADAFVLKIAADEFLVVSFSLEAPKLRERLEAYLIADEVEIADEKSDWVRIGLWGEESSAAVTKWLGGQPVGTDVWREVRGVWIFRGRRSAGENFELLVSRAQHVGIVEELHALGAKAGSAEAAERERIASGIPLVPVDLGLNDLPNEGGLEDVAISYTKGCYLGQEIMARLKNLGQVRRRLHLVRGSGPMPAAGNLLFQNGQKVGEVRSVAPDEGGFVALAMLSLVNLDAAAGLSQAEGGPVNLTIVRRV